MKKVLITILMSALLLALTACSDDDKITIGAQTYTETKILAYMYKDLIEQETDLTVDVKEDIETSPIVLEGMQSGDIDMSTQYTGTALSSFTDIENPKDSDATVEQAEEFFGGDDYEFEVLDKIGYANTYQFTVTEDLAEEKGYEKVSDLKDDADEYKAGFDTAWLERDNDGYPAFQETYGFEFGDTNPMEIGLVYDAVKNGEMDVVLAYSTDPRIVEYDLQLLEDDENFFPPYDAVPMVREEVLENEPGIEDAIEPLFGAFDEEQISILSGKVDNDGEQIEDVATEYLEEEGLLK
ncbi:MAG TPA: glycine betaine ABC transporter substrate-binding protein [Pseudogracilibacillus sp.]|nr:glycine betaine ABC transporter substrate-binding protein [Pseudogracilibacillus sp.]